MDKLFFLIAVLLNLLGSFLFFWIQPLIAKILLPFFGGVASVWTTSVLFFQVVLFLGYTYSYFLKKLYKIKNIVFIHLLILLCAILLLPLGTAYNIEVIDSNFDNIEILVFLAKNLLLLCFILGITSPYTQKVLNLFDSDKFNNPYKLYIASNIGSALGLLGFIFLLEPNLTINQQITYWNTCYYFYILFISCYLGILFFYGKKENIVFIEKLNKSKISNITKLKWFIYSFIPVSLLLCITEYISYEMMAIPLLWVIPLSLYLFSFQLSFSGARFLDSKNLYVGLILLLILSILTHKLSDFYIIVLHLTSFFIMCIWFSYRLYSLKPNVNQLPEFYCFMGFSGILAGIANNFIYPNLLSTFFEYPLLLLLALFITLAFLGKTQKKYILVSFSMVVFIFTIDNLVDSIKGTKTIYQARNFYGVNKVLYNNRLNAFLLQNNGTIHGAELKNKENSFKSNTYYSNLDSLFNTVKSQKNSINVAIAGLGTGSLSCYSRYEDEFTFFEIDSNVVDIASNNKYFSYISNCPPKGGIVMGDARINLLKQKDNYFDLILIDVYSSDSIPYHLLTNDAIEAYRHKLTDNGIIAIHVSSRYFDFLPVINKIAKNLNLNMLKLMNKKDKDEILELSQLKFPSTWVVLSTSKKLEDELLKQDYSAYKTEKDVRLWTDNYANILQALI